jgi:polyether ionophore transport system permease protein
VRVGSAIARRAFADARVRTISFALLFVVAALTQATAYREGYPTLEDRLRFARSVGRNDAARLLYGVPHDLLSLGGYVTWRVGGSLAILAAIWGLLGAVRAMRAEEESGRVDVVLAGAVGRRTVFGAQLAAIAAGAAVLWLAAFVGLVAGKVPAWGAAYLALAIVSVIPVFAGVGALASQVAPTRRMATGLASGVFVVALALRAVADTTSGGAGWLRWLSPLGWAEELRPFADPQPGVLLIPAVTTASLLVAAGALWVRRDVGSGLLPAHDSREPRLALLGSPTAQALRSELAVLVAWLVGVGSFALLMGFLADAVTPDVLSEEVQKQLEKLGTESVVTPSGYLGFAFLFVGLATSLYCCMQIGSVREEEGEQRLETLLAQPVGRRSWLTGRLVVAAAGAAAVALLAGIAAWAGAATQGADVSLPSMLGAGANCLPVALLFLAVGALAYAVVPRASEAIAYGVVGAAFAVELFGSLFEAPGWVLAVSPFHDIGLVPGEAFEAGAAVVMVVLAAVVALASLAIFRRRDLSAA